jgi:CHAD domain-containing protein
MAPSTALEDSLRRALRKQKQARKDLDEKSIHDLRVALRRCRSLAEGFSTLDPHLAWRQLEKVCKKQQRGLTDLRDTQVMRELAERLRLDDGRAGAILAAELKRRERLARRCARKTLEAFPRKLWKRWLRELPVRAEMIPVGEPRLVVMALERLTRARELERRWRKTHSATAWHRTRVAIKRLRYTLESFLPNQRAASKKRLRGLQDILGEGHDLDVLRGYVRTVARATRISPRVQKRWLGTIEQWRRQRAEAFMEGIGLKVKPRTISRLRRSNSRPSSALRSSTPRSSAPRSSGRRSSPPRSSAPRSSRRGPRVNNSDLRTSTPRNGSGQIWDRWRVRLEHMAHLNHLNGAAPSPSTARQA